MVDNHLATSVTGFMADVIRILNFTWEVMVFISLVATIGGLLALLKAFVHWWDVDRHKPPEEVKHVLSRLWPRE